MAANIEQKTNLVESLLQGRSIQALHFVAQDIRFCMDIQYVLRVISLVALQPVPQAPNYMQGVMNLGGEGVPVIDLALRLGLQNTQPYTLNTPIVLCTDGTRRAGIIVEKVLGIADVRETELQMNGFFREQTFAFSGVINVDDELSMLLDLRRLLDVDLSGKETGMQVDPAVIAGALHAS